MSLAYAPLINFIKEDAHRRQGVVLGNTVKERFFFLNDSITRRKRKENEGNKLRYQLVRLIGEEFGSLGNKCRFDYQID